MLSHDLRLRGRQARRSFEPRLHEHEREALELRRVDDRQGLRVGSPPLLLVDEPELGRRRPSADSGGPIASLSDQGELWSVRPLSRVAHCVVDRDVDSLALLDPAGVEQERVETSRLSEAGGRLRLAGRRSPCPRLRRSRPRGPSCQPLFPVGVEEASATGPNIRRTVASTAYGSSCRHGIRALRSGRTCAPQIVVRRGTG